MRNKSLSGQRGENNSEASIEFDPDFRIARLSTFGLAGLLVGMVVLCYPKACSQEANFHEVKYNARVTVASALDSLSKTYLKSIKYKRDSLLRYMRRPAADSNRKLDTMLLKKSIESDTNQIIVCESYRKYYEEASPADTLAFDKLNNLLHFDITPETITKWDDTFRLKGYSWITNARYWVKIPDTKPFIQYAGIQQFSIYHPKSNMQFGSKYPAVGVWVLLIVIFSSFCFIAASTCVYLQNKIQKLFKENKIKLNWSFFSIWLGTVGCLATMLAIWFYSFNDELMIKPLFFMKNFGVSVKLIMGIGYISGSCCLAGFIYISSVMGFFSRSVKDKVKKIRAQKKKVDAKEGDEAAEKQTLANLEREKLRDHTLYNQLLGFFNTYFVLSSVILSLLVFCSGALANTINSLDFVKMLTRQWGYSPVRPDFVYLYGGIHTVLLLLVYIPVKMRFNEIQLPPLAAPVNVEAPPMTAESTPAQSGSSKLFDLLKNPAGQLKDLLVVASPLLASLVQSLFDLLFK